MAPALLLLVLLRGLPAQHQSSLVQYPATGLAVAAIPSPEDQGALWRQTRLCGPNALYMLAIAQGFEVDYERLCADTPIAADGCSMFDLVEAARRSGIPATAGRLNLQTLRDAREPLILHLEGNGLNGTGATGHFVVSAGWENNNSIWLVDGAKATLQRLPLDHLQRKWSGFALRIHRFSNRESSTQIAMAFALAFVAVWFAFSCRRRWRHRDGTEEVAR